MAGAEISDLKGSDLYDRLHRIDPFQEVGELHRYLLAGYISAERDAIEIRPSNAPAPTLLSAMARSVITVQFDNASAGGASTDPSEKLIVRHRSTSGASLDNLCADVVLWLDAPRLLHQQLHMLHAAIRLLRPGGTMLICLPLSRDNVTQTDRNWNRANLTVEQWAIIDVLENAVGSVTLLTQSVGAGSLLAPIGGYQPSRANTDNISPDEHPMTERFDADYLIAIASPSSEPVLPPLGLLSNFGAFIVQPVEPGGSSNGAAFSPQRPGADDQANGNEELDPIRDSTSHVRHTSSERVTGPSSTLLEYPASSDASELGELKTIVEITSTLLAGAVLSANQYRDSAVSAQERIEQLTQELDAIKRSRSWLVTAIPRRLAHRLRRYSVLRNPSPITRSAHSIH